MARPKTLTDEQREQNRRATYREASRKRRQAMAEADALEIRLVFTGIQAQALRRMRDESATPLEEWATTCFERGAKFVFNAGNIRGGKTRVRS